MVIQSLVAETERMDEGRKAAMAAYHEQPITA